MCVCVCVCVCVCIAHGAIPHLYSTYICIAHTCICVCVFVCLCVCLCVYIYHQVLYYGTRDCEGLDY